MGVAKIPTIRPTPMAADQKLTRAGAFPATPTETSVCGELLVMMGPPCQALASNLTRGPLVLRHPGRRPDSHSSTPTTKPAPPKTPAAQRTAGQLPLVPAAHRPAATGW